VPVLIKNFKDKNGNSPNEGSVLSDSWRFVRRFMIFDTLSGIDQVGGYQNNLTANVVRWANLIKMKITLDPENEE
jgi:hypothetical protein